MDSWIKLFRKLKDNELMQDEIALQLFIYLLLSVDRKTGTLKTGRFQLGIALGKKPSTIYHVLERLSKKYKIVNTKTNNKFTEISLLNWAKYNGGVETRTAIRTTKEQQKNTIQEEEKGEGKRDKSLLGKNPEVELVLRLFSEKTGCRPTDKKPRQTAWNLVQLTRTLNKKIRPYFPLERSAELTEERTIEKAFKWYFEAMASIDTTSLETVKRHIDARFYEGIRGKYIPDYKLQQPK